MNLKSLPVAVLMALAAMPSADAGVMWGERRAAWLAEAEAAKPMLVRQVVRPQSIVQAVNDSAAYQHWRYAPAGDPSEMLFSRNMKDVGSVTLDFGRHMTGYFTFHTKTLSRCQDAPVRLRFFFGEMPAELNTPLDPWQGSLSRAWMQDEVVTVTEVDREITLPRRLAFRYVRVELLGASPDFDFALDDMYCTAQSSAGEVTTALEPGCRQDVADIRRVSIETLRECMQTVYEDGPKRDRRLWAGDMYLQTLANRYSFGNYDLTRRCLYLFAALADDDGNVMSNIFETPEPHAQHGSHCMTYSLLWNSTLLEYLLDTDDVATARELWPVARRQVEAALGYVGDDGIYRHSYERGTWIFFDWREGLDMTVPMQGAVIYALDQTCELARRLGLESEVGDWPALADKMRKAARREMYDRGRGVFVSGPGRQVSALGQTWMVKSGVVAGRDARRAIETALAMPDVCMPGTPYATHYLIDAMIMAGMPDRARDYMLAYWGGMVAKGADTFWESYDPDDDFISAYGFSPLNSSCHAWSCTPVYFIHKYPGIFQK
ncbi:MAG: glycoside hydrolase [Bacteroidales bacterium]|nr:glycoside hydrolase [Bacteroidales bacterium]